MDKLKNEKNESDRNKKIVLYVFLFIFLGILTFMIIQYERDGYPFDNYVYAPNKNTKLTQLIPTK
jgi:hypothetical protein